MSNQIEPIARLVNQLSKLPGIGKKSAQRLAFYIVSRPEEQVRELAVSIFNAKREVHYCALCGDYTTDELCPICRDESRKNGQICVVSTPRDVANLERMNDVKGREQFRPVAPMVLLERAPEIFGRGPIPSPYMLFVHDVAPEWKDRIPTVTHVDGTARIQTIDRETEPLVHRMISAFERRTGIPVVSPRSS